MIFIWAQLCRTPWNSCIPTLYSTTVYLLYTVLLWLYCFALINWIKTLLTAHYAFWHVGQQQRSPTLVFWFWAVFWTSPHVRFIDFILSSTVRRKVVLGRPLFLLPSGVQWRASLGMLSCSLLKTCPIQFQHRFVIMPSMLSCWHLVNRSSFAILSTELKELYIFCSRI